MGEADRKHGGAAMTITRTEETGPDGIRVAVTRVETEKGIGTARMPILDEAGERRREERIAAAFAELLRGCVRTRGEAWVRERLEAGS